MVVLDIVALVVALVAIAFGVLAVLRARAAEDLAQAARQRADRAALDAESTGQESSLALERSAEARADAAQALDRATSAAHDAAQARNHSAAASRDAARAIGLSERASANADAAVSQLTGRPASTPPLAEPAAAPEPDEQPRVLAVPAGGDTGPTEVLNLESVRWQLEQVKGGLWLLRNVGFATARAALLSDATQPPKYVRPDEVIPRDVAQGDHLQFRAAPTRGAPPPRVRVTWREGEDPTPHAHETTLLTE